MILHPKFWPRRDNEKTVHSFVARVASNIEKKLTLSLARVFNISGPGIEFPHFSSPILRQLQGKNTGSRVIRSIWLVSLLQNDPTTK